MVDNTLLQIVATLLSFLVLGFGGSPSPVADVPAPVEVPSFALKTGYPTHVLWDMPYGLHLEEVADIVEAQTGLTPAREESSLSLDTTEQLTVLGYPADLFAYFSDTYTPDGVPVLSSASFGLSISDITAYGLEVPVSDERGSLEEALDILATQIDEVAGRAQAAYAPMTKTEVVVWAEEDSDMTYVDSPFALDGTLEADALREIIVGNQTTLIYLYYDNVELMFYTASYDSSLIVSASVRYSYFDLDFQDF